MHLKRNEKRLERNKMRGGNLPLSSTVCNTVKGIFPQKELDLVQVTAFKNVGCHL